MGANALSHLIPNPNLNPKPNPVRKCISTGYAKTVPQQGGADKNWNSPLWYFRAKKDTNSQDKINCLYGSLSSH